TEVDVHRGAGHGARLDVAHVDVLDHASAHGVGLDAEYAVEIGAVHFAVLGEHVADVARTFAAQRDAAVPVLHGALLHDDVFRGRVQPPPIAVAAGLDGDAI